MLLEDLCSSLSVCKEWYGLQTSEYGLREERTVNPNYEIPEIREIQTCAPLTPSLYLITAPAAVGKSTAASYMGNQLKSPILDLAKLQVGTGTLEGALAKSLGYRKNAEFMGALVEGRASLIIDALDEAEVRSGQANFRAFINGVADTASEVSNGPSIVVLSRAESARGLQDIFAEWKLQYSHYEIQPFGREQAYSYLDRQMCLVYDKQEKEPIHHRHVRPFEDARNSLFLALASALDIRESDDIWDSREVREFLGYAPVLGVAAEYLAVENFTAIRKSIGSSRGPGLGQWDLVANVIDQLLEREQEKFVTQFKETSEFQQHGFPSLTANLYSPEEQCGRLLDYVENLLLDLDLPASLPTELRDPYETAVSVQLANHPFVRGDGWFNVIFRDYVTARSLCSPVTSLQSAQHIRKRIVSSDWKHSPMFGYFAFSLGKADGAAESSCHSEEIGALYESFKSMCEAEDELSMAVGRTGNRLSCSFVVTRNSPSAGVELIVGPLNFLSHQGTKSVSFPRELSRTHIYDVPDVILGGEHKSFKFGPGVYISCGDLLVSTSELQVHCGKEGGPVFITANAVTSESVKINADSSELAIVCDDLSFPWSRYQKRVNIDSLTSDIREASSLFLELRRLVLRFKDAKNGEGAVYQPMMDNLVIGSNRRARTALDYLQSIGCVKLHSHMYLLDFAEFAKHGLSRPQLRELQGGEAATRMAIALLEYSKSTRGGKK